MDGKVYKVLMPLILLCLFDSCRKDTPGVDANSAPTASRLVYVACEGNYGANNASLYALHPSVGSVFGDIFKTANGGKPLGDVFQSMVRIGAQYYLCINNSDRIVVLDTGTYVLKTTIMVSQPRYIMQVTSSKAYISALYGNKVSILDLATNTIIGTIPLPARNPEGMCMCGNLAAVACWDTGADAVCLIDPNTDEVMHVYHAAGRAPQEVLTDKNGMLWVLSGNSPENAAPYWTEFEPSTGAILKKMDFPPTVNPVRPIFNRTKDTLIFIEANYFGGTSQNGIFEMGINDTALPATPIIPAVQNQYFWALGVDPATGNLYVGDPKGFTQNGEVYIYTNAGVLQSGFKVGLGPGHFYFDYK